MSDDNTQAEAQAKAKTEYETVKMEDGREVRFAGKRQIDKTVEVDAEKQAVTVRFDFRNGKTLSIASTDLSIETVLKALGHGLSQKCGDEAAGSTKVEDSVLAVEDMMTRLKEGKWEAARAAGDSFSGASLVIRAICEVTGKSVEAVKAFLNGKLEAAKARGEKLSRADLYASFRAPNSATGAVIQRMEQEERAKNAKVDAGDLISELEATA